MGKGSIGKLPVLGDIVLPVHLMTYDNRDNPKQHFHSNFAFWHSADGASDVSTDEGQIGTIGGTMGGHVEMNRYYPNLDRSKEHTKEGSYRQWIEVIIDVQDMWNQIEALLDTPGAKVTINGLEEIQEKYQALKKAEREAEEVRKAKLEAVRQMQREAEEEAEKKVAISSLVGGLLAGKKEKEKLEENNKVKYWIGEYGVIEDGGWDLTAKIDTSDHNYMEDDEDIFDQKIIPLNYGTGIKVIDKKGKIWVSEIKKTKHPEVTLKITSWVGTAAIGAIHYYGTLNFGPTWLIDPSRPNYTTSTRDLRIFNGNKIALAHELEEWEFRDHPGSYDGWRVGDWYSGFYTEEDVIKSAQKFFDNYFAKGWKLVIDN